MKTIKDKLVRIRRVCTYFHHSPEATSVLSNQVKALDLPNVKVIKDCPTRWNSTYFMLERYLMLQPAIISALVSPDLQGKRAEFNYVITMTEAQEDELKAVVSFLSPLERITNLMCTSTHATISLIMPLINSILSSAAALDGDKQLICDMKAILVKDLSSRYQGNIEVNKDSSMITYLF